MHYRVFLKTTPFRELAKSPEDILNELEDQLETKIRKVNENINNGFNEGVVLNAKKKNGWSLPYKRRDDEETEGNEGSKIPSAQLLGLGVTGKKDG